MRRELHRVGMALIAGAALAAGCGNGGEQGQPDPSAFVAGQRIVYQDGLHNENTEMIRLEDGRILMAFRGGERGQVGSDRAVIRIYESSDDGRIFDYLDDVTMPPASSDREGAGRDIRDPKFVRMGDKLFLYAIARLPGFTYRDLFKFSWTVRAESSDDGRTWTEPERIRDENGEPFEQNWGFWRFTKRQYDENGQEQETLYATGYSDGDIIVGLFSSDDGIHWTQVSEIINSYDDAPSEAELQFFGENDEAAVSIVRLDNQGNLDDGESAICTSRAPFEQWECGRRVPQRLGGPTWVVRRENGQIRNFIFARKHLPCTFKRTAAYEIRGDLANPDAGIEMCEIQELMSSGDTAYTALVPITDDRWLLSWYSTPPDRELAWLQGQFEPSDIWLADVHFDRAPETCTTPVKAGRCPAAPLPSGDDVFDITGSHLLTVSPVIWPSNPMFFRADVVVDGSSLDLSLQPLVFETKEPVGEPWVLAGLPIESDGSFAADFGARALPIETYPIVDIEGTIDIRSFVLTGKTTSTDGFCGGLEGHAQFFTQKPADRIGLDGSRFGAVRIAGEGMPEPVDRCPE